MGWQRLVVEHLALRSAGAVEREIAARAADDALPRADAGVSGGGSRTGGAGEQVLIAAASAGELERLADLCREYEVPYRLGEFEQSATRRAAGGGGRVGQRSAALCWFARRCRRAL